MSRRSFFLRRLAAAGLLLLLGAICSAQTGPRSGKWAHEGSTLAPDTHVVWGRLDNGFRYALLPHQGVPGRVALQLLVLSGSLDEKPDELGIAHYTEHMAFGGSKNFKSEEMIALFQRLGVEYGSDVNANTTFDYTAFRLDYRENDPALLREGMRLFRDFGDGVSFPPEIIERERKVVLAELRLRDTLAGQKEEAAMPVVFRGLKFPERSPGGKAELVGKFTREQFLKFYQRCYRPDLMVLIGAGDLDPAAMAALVHEIFGSMVRPHEPVPVRDEGKLDAKALRAGVFRVAGVGSASVEIASVAGQPAVADTREAHLERQRRQFVMRVFAERLRSEIPNAGEADASYEILLGNGVAAASVSVGGPDWSHGVLALDQMVRTTLERGVDAADLETLRRRELRLATHLIEQLPTMDPGSLCDALIESITAHTVFTGLEREGEWRREWLEKITPAEAQQVFRGLWAVNSLAFHVAGGVGIELEADKILQAVQKYRKSGLTYLLPKQHKDAEFKLPKLGVPTAVVERRELPALNARLLRFGNNVHANFVSSRQEPGLVRVLVRVGNGLLEMPGNRPALKEFGLNTLLASGTVHFPPEQLGGLIAERFLDFGFDVSDRDAFTFRGTMAVEQLETFLGLVADLLKEPQFNSYVHQEERMNAAMGRSAQSMGMGDGMRALTDHLFKGDARFTSGSPLDYIQMSVVDVKRWMEPPLARGYVEATIVGDVTDETAVSTLARTLGALPPRALTKVTAKTPKPAVVSARAGFERIEFTGEQNLGLVVGTWPVTGMNHVRDEAALEVLAKILEIRVRTEIREKLGLAYAPSAELASYDGFPGFALLQAHIDCGPNDGERVAHVMETIGAGIAENGVSEGEFIGSRGILKSQLKRSFRENGFLVSLLMRAQERPEETEEIVKLHGDLIDGVTREEVNKWAAEALPKKNCRSAAVVPKAFIGVFETPDPR